MPDRSRTGALSLLLLAMAALAVVAVARIWLRNESLSLSVAGFYMVSDASGYVECSRWLLATGQVGLDWCERRPLYPALLATLSALTGRVWLLTMLAQAVIVTFCVLALTRTFSRQFGLIAAIVVFWLLFVYAKEHALPLSMTENGGIIFGALALVFLLDGCARQDPRWLSFGAALLSIALFARAGPLLVLPALIVWALVHYRRNFSQAWKVLALVVAATAVGPLMQAMVTGLAGGSITNAQSNFSYTLYGLAVGGKGWSAVLTEQPHVLELYNLQGEERAAREIYSLATQAILDDPKLFLKALGTNLANFLRQPLFDNPGARLWGLPNILWWLGAIACVLKRRDATYSLIGSLSAGVALSSSIIGQDAGPRVFAAGFGILAVQAGIGLSFALQLMSQGRKALTAEAPRFVGPGKFEISLAILALALVLMPVTPARRLFAHPSAPDLSCDPPLRSIVARPGYETHYLAIASGARPADAFRMRVAPERLKRRLNDASWFKQDFASLQAPITIFRAWPLNKSTAPGEVRFFAPADLSGYRYQAIHVCLNDRDTISLAGVAYSRASSVTLVPSLGD